MLMLKFIDWLMVLPRELEERVIARMEKLSREKAMPYVTSWELIGLEKGLKRGLARGRAQGLTKGRAEGQAQGLEQGLREAIRIDLELRFGREGKDLLPVLGKVTGVARLRAIKRAVVTAQSVENLKGLLRRQ